ncbi:MAG: threonine synthase [Coriobacteriia bacterium]|nr:threonine synthase [Coriobacteriia bacterium]MBN2839699.1 threonine synthase [Coriobacteriia bacterium]
MDTVTHYVDTRGLDDSRPAFSRAVVTGIAPGGGLFVPERLPEMTLEEILSLSELTYPERAAAVFTRFGVDVTADRVTALMSEAYGGQWDDERIAPVVEVVPGMHVLELWHGPTSAFKDMALQCMPLFFSEAVEAMQSAGELTDDFLILVATSGDTGKAALEGFADRAHTGIVVFYPEGGVSDIQRLQMVTQRGQNVGVFGVRGNFDDCQSAVKAAFNDADFSTELRDRHGLRLSSANSINWGRLLPQIAYYVSAYADMVASGGVKPGSPMDVCVPTGNFGNILGACYARHMGVPIGRLLCASNENNVLTDFIATGTYDISDRAFVTTPSPSMDILISSNLERLLYHLAGPDAVRGWMAELTANRRFTVDRETFRQVRELFSADWASNDESLATIRRVYDERGYLMDPHTAVAWEVAERLRGQDPVLVVATAHWAKFGADVYRALTNAPYGEPLSGGAGAMSGLELLAEVRRIAPNVGPVPAPLAEIACLDPRFSEVVDAGAAGVEDAVREWLGR